MNNEQERMLRQAYEEYRQKLRAIFNEEVWLDTMIWNAPRWKLVAMKEANDALNLFMDDERMWMDTRTDYGAIVLYGYQHPDSYGELPF